MIGRIRGVLVPKDESGLVIEAGGLGYEVKVTPEDLASLPDPGEEIVLHTHLVVREDLLALYGFDGRAGRDMFRILLTASGVGPALALALLSTLRPAELQQAVAADDVAALSLTPGIGKRKAEKLLVDLRPKVGTLSTISAPSSEVVKVRAALESLGYQPSEIQVALEGITGKGTAEEMIRDALRVMGRDRGLTDA